MSMDLSRRNFLKGAGIVSAGAALAATLGACSADGATGGGGSAEGDSGTDESGDRTTCIDTRPEPGNSKHPLLPDTPGKDAEPIDPLDAPSQWDDEVDVVVVGSGMGGSTAAAYLAQNGLSVIMVEKDVIFGGASRQANYNHINCGGSKAQTEAGYWYPATTDGFDSQVATQEVLKKFQYSVDPVLLEHAIINAGKWADWMYENPDMEWELSPAGFFYANKDFVDGKKSAPIGNGHTIDTLVKIAQDNGAQCLTRTRCDGLVMEDGTVTGIKVTDLANDEEKYFKADKGVVLCAGGFGANLDMLEKYAPSIYKYAAAGGPMATHTGETIRMGVGAGADISGYNSFCCWDTGIEEYWGDSEGDFYQYLFDPVKDIQINPFLQVAVDGTRLPVYASQDVLDIQPFTAMGEACENQYIAGSSDNRKRVIMDANFLDVAKANYEASGNDRAYPISQYSKERLNDEAYESMGQYSEDFDGCWQDAIDKGYVKTGNTIEELAEQLGMDPQALKDAVDNYNSLVDAGKDDQLVVPYPIETMAKVTDAPFYGIIVGPHIGKTLCGLRVNMKSQVISVDNEPIPGLYAGYTTAGGFCGENLMNSYWGAPSICAGVGMSGVGGWMCANSILGNYDSIENIWDERVTANKIDTDSDQKASIGGPLGSNSTKGSDDAASGF